MAISLIVKATVICVRVLMMSRCTFLSIHGLAKTRVLPSFSIQNRKQQRRRFVPWTENLSRAVYCI